MSAPIASSIPSRNWSSSSLICESSRAFFLGGLRPSGDSSDSYLLPTLNLAGGVLGSPNSNAADNAGVAGSKSMFSLV